MSVIASKTRNDAEFATARVRGNRSPTMSAASVAAAFVRKVAMKSTRLFMHAAQSIAEARMQRAAIEVQLYLNRYHHSSKNDDDLPVVEPDLEDHLFGKAPAQQRLRACSSALVKRTYPIVVAFAIFAVILVLAIALRIAVWLPTFAPFKPV